jgi:hypothetical protein
MALFFPEPAIGLENLAILRHLATNLLKRENSLTGGLQTKRLKAAWDHAYLLKVLASRFLQAIALHGNPQLSGHGFFSHDLTRSNLNGVAFFQRNHPPHLRRHKLASVYL